MKVFFTLVIIFLAQIGFSQACIPDTAQIPESSLIYPVPYQDTVPGSGIPNKACIGAEYSQVFQVKIPIKVEFLGTEVEVDQITLNSIDGLPEGLTYDCNPTGCLMLQNTIGCMNIHGTPTANNAVKKYPITLNFTFKIKFLGEFQLSFPNQDIAPGIYEIEVLPSGSSACIASTTENNINLNHNAFVNEALDQLILKINSKEILNARFEIYNITGNMMSAKDLKINNGPNEYAIDINALKGGAYFYNIRSGKRFESGKIFIPGN